MQWIDNTAATAYEGCPRSYYWRHVAHLTAERTLSHAIAYGSAGHWALEQAFTRLKGGASLEHCLTVLLASFNDKWEELAEQLDHSVDDWRGPTTFAEAAPEWWYQMAQLLEMWPQVVATETRLAVPIPGTTWHYKCRIDLALGTADLVTIIDHKFTGRSLATVIPAYSGSPQLPTYAWAWRQRFPGTVSAAYNLLHSSRRRTTTGWGKPSISRALAFCNTSPPILAMMEERLRYAVRSIEHSLQANEWPLHLSRCQGSYDSCQYVPLCQRCGFAPPTDAHLAMALELGFVQQPWDPFAL